MSIYPSVLVMHVLTWGKIHLRTRSLVADMTSHIERLLTAVRAQCQQQKSHALTNARLFRRETALVPCHKPLSMRMVGFRAEPSVPTLKSHPQRLEQNISQQTQSSVHFNASPSQYNTVTPSAHHLANSGHV